MTTPVALPPIRTAANAPFTGGVGGFAVRAWVAATGELRDEPPPVTQIGVSNAYRVEPTEDDEATGIVVEVDTGAGNLPRYVVLNITSATRDNQVFAYSLANGDGSRWAGSAGSVGIWNGADSLDLAKFADGVFVARASTADIAAAAQGLINAPNDAYPPQLTAFTEALGSGGSGPSSFLISSVEVVDDHTVNVTFNRKVRVNGQLYVPTNFVIEIRIGDANESYVESVELLTPGSPASVTSVLLKLAQPLSAGGRYSLRVDNLSDEDDVAVSPPSKSF